MEFDVLDHLWVQGMAWVDHRCRKFRVRAHPWSPSLAEVCSKLDLMRALVQQAEGFEVMGLVNAITRKHQVVASAPMVHQGSQPIDGIWTTLGLLPTWAGYLGFDCSIPSNHRALWVEYMPHAMFGYEIPRIIRPPAQ